MRLWPLWMHRWGVWTGRACEPRVCVRGQSGRMGLICVLAVCVGRAVRVACVCFGGPGGVGNAACTALHDVQPA